MALIREINQSDDPTKQTTVTLVGTKYKCIKTTLSTSEKAFINVLTTEDPMLLPSGQFSSNQELQLPYWENQVYKSPILPHESIFEVFDSKGNTALCFNVLIHKDVDLLDSECAENVSLFIDWCYQVLELKFDLQFFFNRWEGKIMKNLKFKKFNDSSEDTVEFILDEENEQSDEDDEVKNIVVSKALLDEEQEDAGEQIMLNGLGNSERNIKKGLIQEIEPSSYKAKQANTQQITQENVSQFNKVSNDLNF